MKHLVLGGTGFIGKPLVGALLERGQEVVVFSRGEKPVEVDEGVTHIPGDRFELEAAAEAIDAFNPDSIIDIYALDTEKDPEVFKFFSTRVSRYTMLSSCDVYRVMGRLLGTEPGPLIEGLQTEESPLRQKLYPYRDLMEHAGGDNYDKIPLERACLEDYEFAGTVLRLPMIFGPGDRQHRWRDVVAHIVAGRPAILYPEAYANWTSSYGYIDNVVAAIAEAATNEKAMGEIFNVGDVNNKTQVEWAGAFARAENWTGRIVQAPTDALPEKRAAFADGEDSFTQLLTIDSSKIESKLGFRPPIDFEAAIKNTAAYERESLGGDILGRFDFDADDAFLSQSDNTA